MKYIKRTCHQCKNKFIIDIRYIKCDDKRGKTRGKYCSKACQNISQITLVNVNCVSCNASFQKHPSQIRSKNSFCNRSCAAKFNNKNKTKGTRRSKLEVYLDSKIKEAFPKLKYDTNKLYEGYEFDFRFPELNLAIEINGIFHRKPIFGEEKLKRIKKNDRAKKRICKRDSIKLVVLSDKDKNFTPKQGDELFEAIKKLIEE